jgi:hypothetical protein
MRKIVGGSLPAELWHAYMAEAEKDLPERELMAGPPGHGGVIDAVTTGVSDAIGGLINSIFGGDGKGR